MPRKVTPVPLSQLSLHGLSPVRPIRRKRLDLTWEVAESNWDVDLMVALAGRPELSRKTVERAMDCEDESVALALAARADLEPEDYLRLVAATAGDWEVCQAALVGSGWEPEVVDTSFDLLEWLPDEEYTAALQWLWKNAWPEALTAQDCLLVLLGQAGELGQREHGRREAAFAGRLGAGELAALLRDDRIAADARLDLLLNAPVLDEDVAALAWELAQGDDAREDLVAAALARHAGVAPRVRAGGTTVRSSQQLPPSDGRVAPGRRDAEDTALRRVHLNCAWLVRTGRDELIYEVADCFSVNSDFIGQGFEQSMLARMQKDFAALVSLVGRLGDWDCLDYLVRFEESWVAPVPAGVRMPSRLPGLADLKALGANDFVLECWAEHAPVNVILSDGWEHVAPMPMAWVLAEAYEADEADLDAVRDVLEKGLPDDVLGMLPGELYAMTAGHPRMVRWVGENVPAGGVEILERLAAGQMAGSTLADVLVAVQGVVTGPA